MKSLTLERVDLRCSEAHSHLPLLSAFLLATKASKRKSGGPAAFSDSSDSEISSATASRKKKGDKSKEMKRSKKDATSTITPSRLAKSPNSKSIGKERESSGAFNQPQDLDRSAGSSKSGKSKVKLPAFDSSPFVFGESSRSSKKRWTEDESDRLYAYVLDEVKTLPRPIDHKLKGEVFGRLIQRHGT